MEEIHHQINALANDNVRGATAITIDAVALIAHAALIQCQDSEWPNNLRSVVEQVIHTKPTMASLMNACHLAYSQIAKLDSEQAFSRVTAIAKKICRDMTEALQQSAANCAKAIADDAIVLTCSSSSSVIEALSMVHRVMIYAPDGNPQMADLLATKDIPSELVNQIHVDRIDCAVIGCDAITPEYVINGSPSLEMAKRIQHKVPLYVIGQTMKEIDRIEIEAGFDRVPVELISKIFTERSSS